MTEYDYSYYSESKRKFKQQVWDNWRTDRNHCKGCPVRCPEAHPDFGAFDTDADLMIVAEAPGVGSGGARAIDEVDEDTNWERVDDEPLFEFYDRNVAENWSKPGSGQSFIYIEELLRTDRLPLSPTEVYYTNAIKCGKTDSWNVDENARNHCLGYLRTEIRELVKPSVIVPMGDHAIRAVDDIVNFSQFTETRTMKLLLNDCGDSDSFPVLETNDPTLSVIPSKHWRYLGSYVAQHISWAEDSTEYWDKLGARIIDALNSVE